MPISRRLESLGNGVFARVDHAKQVYCDRVSSQGEPALIDLSIGSSDLEPPLAVLEAMATGIMHPSSALSGLGYTPDYLVYHELILTRKMREKKPF